MIRSIRSLRIPDRNLSIVVHQYSTLSNLGPIDLFCHGVSELQYLVACVLGIVSTSGYCRRMRLSGLELVPHVVRNLNIIDALTFDERYNWAFE
jgi:hypothetical protein